MAERTVNCSQDGGDFNYYTENDGADAHEGSFNVAGVRGSFDCAVAARATFKEHMRAKGYTAFRFEDAAGRLGVVER